MGKIVNEAAGGLLTEAGGSLVTEEPGSVSVSLPVAQVAAAGLAPVPVVSVPLPVARVTATALTLTPASGTSVALPVAQVTVAAPVPSLAAGPVALPAAAVTVAAPLPAPSVSVPLPVAQVTAAALSPASGAGPVSLPAAAVTVSAPLPTPAAAVPLPAAAVTAAGLALAPSVAVPLPAAQVTVAGHPLTPSAPVFVALPAAQVTVAALPVTPFVPPVFPVAPLDLECQLNLGGTWTDVTTYAYQRGGESPPITITRGRPDESGTANPSTCAWEWNNRDGRFSPKNPLSPYFGLLGRNTPVRWSVPAQSAYLRLEEGDADRAFVQDTASLHVTGSIEMRVALRLTDWQGCALAQRLDNTTPSWEWVLNGDGTLTFGYWDSGGTFRVASSDVPAPFTSGDMALRLTLDATTGTLTFYAAASIDGTYTQLGDALAMTGGASTSIRAGNAALATGWANSLSDSQMSGRVYEFRLYNGIGGSLAADGIFSAQAPGATTWTDPQGNTWNLAGGAEISARDYRFHGEMSAQPPKWDVTGTDMSVMAAAGGPLRRLTAGTNNAVSAMKRAILAQTGAFVPAAYWPMEDADGATVFGSAVTGGSPMTFDLSPAPSLATDSTFTASAPLPTMGGSRLQGPVAPYTATGTWTVRFLLKVAVPAAPAVLLRVVTPGGACGVVYVSVDTSGGLEIEGFGPGGTSAFNTGFFNMGPVTDTGVWCSLEAQPAGGGVQYSLVTLAPGASVGFDINATVSNGLPSGNVSLVQPDVTGLFADTVIGHLQVQTTWQSLFNFAEPLNAWTGEAAADRYARLAAENGYQCRILGSPAYSALMGPQGIDTLSDLLTECEDADLGQQFEPRQQLALGYRTLASMCGQAPALTLDYAQSQPGGVNGDGSDSGLEVTYDDQLAKNDWTVTRGASSGSQGATVQVQLDDGSAMSVSPPPDGIGDYANTATANIASDANVVDVAGWLVRIGTIDEARWPVIPVNLARPEMSPLLYEAIGLEVGDYLELLNVPDMVLVDQVRQLTLGFAEKLGGFHWTLEYNAVPEAAYEVALLDDPVFGRADTDGSTLFAGISSTATTMQVVTLNAQLVTWTTLAADFPFDISVAGERMTVTNITGTGVSTQTFTVTRSVNGVVKSQSAGADVRLWFSPILALT